MYDLIILGGGPAGVAAGIYAARKKINSVLITESFGGQSVIAAQINNFVGFESISGVELKNLLENHLRSYQNGIEIKEGFKIENIEKTGNGFAVIANNERFEAKTLLVALGSRYRKLDILGEKKFEGRGVFYCSTCDAPFLKDKTAVVVGGGNSAFYAIFDLLPYASKIYVLVRSDILKADLIYIDKIKSLDKNKVEIIFSAEVEEIIGEDFVSAVKYLDKKTGKTEILNANGVFVAIGYEPNSGIVKDLARINEKGKIVVNCETQETTCKGIWAAGDISSVLYGQINIAIGDAVKAILNIYDYLKK